MSTTHTSTAKSRRINQEIDDLKREDLERRITELSPDGRPAYPTINAADVLWLVFGSFVAILALSVVTLFVWGWTGALLVFVLGLGLALVGNPVIWAMLMRAREREEIRHDEGL